MVLREHIVVEKMLLKTCSKYAISREKSSSLHLHGDIIQIL